MQRLGIAASTVSGTGPNGRIVEADVLRRQANQPAAATVAGSISPMRRAVAAKVSASFATVPHFYLRSEIDVTSLMQLREQNIDAFERHCGVRPTLTDLILRAMGIALRDCPHANRIWQNDTIVQLPTVDVGVVVQISDGLMIPIIRQADRLGLLDLARERVRLTDAVRRGTTSVDAFQGGAMSLTNIGRHRVDEFAPIISPPQCGMLAVGRIAERPGVVDGKICVRQTIVATLAVDHRVMDGVPAAEFLDKIVELLEKPFVLLCEFPST
jgi:pyruvate dehydrogenase E2 component (dihydrolipoamide acetyltransferase)